MAIKSFYLHGKMIFAFQMMDNGDEANVHICYSFGSARKRFTGPSGALSVELRFDYVIGFGFLVVHFVLTRHPLIATGNEVSVSIT